MSRDWNEIYGDNCSVIGDNNSVESKQSQSIRDIYIKELEEGLFEKISKIQESVEYKKLYENLVEISLSKFDQFTKEQIKGFRTTVNLFFEKTKKDEENRN
jgi:hypothetical protein